MHLSLVIFEKLKIGVLHAFKARKWTEILKKNQPSSNTSHGKVYCCWCYDSFVILIKKFVKSKPCWNYNCATQCPTLEVLSTICRSLLKMDEIYMKMWIIWRKFDRLKRLWTPMDYFGKFWWLLIATFAGGMMILVSFSRWSRLFILSRF